MENTNTMLKIILKILNKGSDKGVWGRTPPPSSDDVWSLVLFLFWIAPLPQKEDKIFHKESYIVLNTSQYFEDILDHPHLTDCSHDGWGHLHWPGFCLSFPKIYNTWGIKWDLTD